MSQKQKITVKLELTVKNAGRPLDKDALIYWVKTCLNHNASHTVNVEAIEPLTINELKDMLDQAELDYTDRFAPKPLNLNPNVDLLTELINERLTGLT